ncbi:MAG: sigma-70 family RNA polymerase sigma factor [Roseivirga sp.]|nr:sigma-70 family RNA polymerase sigma factor [Roseivirga sp.]
MEETFLELIEEHQQIIHRVCGIYRDSPEDREDLFQEVVFQLWKAYPAYEARSKFTTWMYRIALNTAMAVFRKKEVAMDLEEDMGRKYGAVGQTSVSENEERLYESLRQLNDAEKAIVSLYLEDYSHREIGEIIGISENYVGVRMNRIKQKLKRILS